MPMTLLEVPNCYYLKASFHAKKKDDPGLEITLWNNGFGIRASFRHAVMHERSFKKDFDSIEDVIEFAKEFATGEKRMTQYLLIHSPFLQSVGEISVKNAASAKVVGVFTNSNSALERAKQIISNQEIEQPCSLYVVSVCGRVSLEPVLITFDGGTTKRE